MSDHTDHLNIRIQGCAGRITLTRPEALNALTYEMCRDIHAAINAWQDTENVKLIVIDAEGDRAFCAGGDVAEVYRRGRQGDAGYAQDFWRDEYHMNLALADHPKPIVSFMQGFVLGGGVGLGCHVTHRIVGETAQIGMPESLIGLVTDVGGTLLLARAPGRIGDYLMLTAQRMDAASAIATGFADHLVPKADWPQLIETLCDTGDTDQIPGHASPPLPAQIMDHLDDINAVFSKDTLTGVMAELAARSDEFATKAHDMMSRHDPLAMAASRALIDAARQFASLHDNLKDALAGEYRFTYRAVEQANILEGVRARLIDKDNSPHWPQTLATAEQAAAPLIAPLGAEELWG